MELIPFLKLNESYILEYSKIEIAKIDYINKSISISLISLMIFYLFCFLIFLNLFLNLNINLNRKNKLSIMKIKKSMKIEKIEINLIFL